MNGPSIHQLVHGYEHGHSLLAASIELGRDDMDLVGRLSDLSGVLGPDIELNAYLSLYPLPSNRFFAVAKTWPDESAPRSGCVLTHTLLIPLELWARDKYPSRFAAALRKPSRESLSAFANPVAPESLEGDAVSVEEPLGEVFIQRYFGEGLAPLVWFGAFAPERVIWCVIQALWPRLRAQFACCTLALQPRTLTDRPFDLVFAPKVVFSRFREFARAHILEGETPADIDTTEPWLRTWSRCVFQRSASDLCTRVQGLSSHLEAQPTAIRTVLFFVELQDRANESPTAAIGALDLLENLAPQPSQARQDKINLALAALESIRSLPPGQAQELLYPLCTRLEEHSFAPDERLESSIRDFAARIVEDDPEQRLADANSIAARHSERVPGLFMRGIADAMTKLLESDHLRPTALVDKTPLMERLTAYNPDVVATVLQSSTLDDRDELMPHVVEWCRAQQQWKVRQALRGSLLPLVTKANDAALVEELLRDVDANEAAQVCDVIESNRAYRSATLSKLVSRLVGERYPSEVRAWAARRDWNSYQTAVVLAATYDSTPAGIDELLAHVTAPSNNRALLLTAFLDRASAFSPPSWLLSTLEGQIGVWEILLPSLEDKNVSDVVVRIVRGGLKRSPLARVKGAPSFLALPKNVDFTPVKEYALRQYFADLLEKLSSIDDMRYWHEQVWVLDTLKHVRADFFAVILTDNFRQDSGRWARAWEILENIPDDVLLTNESFVSEAISSLLHDKMQQWSTSSANSWASVLRKVTRANHVGIGLCNQALHFSLEHRQLPLAAVVAQSFYPVHMVAMEDKQNRGPWWLWGFGGWDKAKDLRRSLVESFLQSDWPPYYFALAAREPWLLRKLCKRMMRQWKGVKFIESAYSGLRNQSENQVPSLTAVLQQVLRDPESIEEDWD